MRAFLPTMGNDLVALNTFSETDEANTVKGLLSTSPAKPKVALEATFPVRERAMVSNIKAATRPLLVQVGDDHVANLKKRLGALVTEVRLGTSLEKFTKRS